METTEEQEMNDPTMEDQQGQTSPVMDVIPGPDDEQAAEENDEPPADDGEMPPDMASEHEETVAEPPGDAEQMSTEENQELEEQEMMAQTVTAAVAEHLRAEQLAIDDQTVFITEEMQDGNHGPGSSRFPSLKPNMAHIARLPSPRGSRNQHGSRLHILTRGIPTKMVKMSKVSMSARARVSTSHPSNYVLNPRRPQKTVTLDQAMSARPPLRIDMEGPTPCSYSPGTKPLNETNSPHWSFGQRNFIEKGGGGRTSWEKTWFQTPHVWLHKADFQAERRWPNPVNYNSQPAMGPHHPVARAGVSHSIGIRRAMVINKKGSELEPAPNEYNKEISDQKTYKKAPSYTHSFRRNGTILWSTGESLDNPGPGTYNPKGCLSQPHRPAFTIQGIRREKSHYLGPYATF